MNLMKPKQSSFTYKLLIGIAIVAILAFAIINSNSSRRHVPPNPESETVQTEQPQVNQINLTARLLNDNIVITNNNAFDWNNARITVTNGPLQQFSLQAGTVKAGETQSYPLAKFMSIDGEMFNTLKHVPKQIVIYADNAAGGKPL